jgi:hypothetical protein
VPSDSSGPAAQPVTGEWAEYAREFVIPAGVNNHVNLALYLAEDERGPLFLDDVSLHDERFADVRFLPSVNRLVVDVDWAFPA